MAFSVPALAASPDTTSEDAVATSAPDEAVEADVEAPDEDAKAEDASEAEDSEVVTTDTGGPVELESEEDALGAMKNLYAALTNRNWTLATGLVLALLVWVARRFKLLDKIPAAAVPWTAAGLSMAGYLVASFHTTGVGLRAALVEGVVAGATAVGLWEMVLKHLLPKKTET